MKHRRLDVRTHTASALVVGLVIAGGAWAAIPDGSGTIQACYSKSTGALRVAERAADCRAGETPLTWSQAGPTGPTGPAGAPGPAGPANPTLVAERHVTLHLETPGQQAEALRVTGPSAPAGEWTLQTSITPGSSWGNTAADVRCDIGHVGTAPILTGAARVDRAAGLDATPIAWTQHTTTTATSTLGDVTCTITNGQAEGYLTLDVVMVATKIG